MRYASLSTKTILVLLLVVGLALLLLSQREPQVGYGTLTADPGSSIPVSSALFRAENAAGILIWEAAVEAVEPISQGRVFVEQSSGTATGLALVNAGSQSVVATFVLRDSEGLEIGRKSRTFAAGEHLPRFINQEEFFPSIEPGFSGSLSFQVEGGQLAAVTLRSGTNHRGEAISATLPVVNLEAEADEEAVVFPQIGVGSGLSTQLILMSTTERRIGGTIELFGSDGLPLELRLNGDAGSQFPYSIEAQGTLRLELTRDLGPAVAGYAVIQPDAGTQSPSGTAIFQFRSGDAVISEAGVGAIPPTSRARIYVDTLQTSTGVAVASPGNPGTTVTFDLFSPSGRLQQSTQREIPEKGHLAIFVEELFPGLPAAFTGLLEISSTHPVVPITLKLTINERGDPIVTTAPVVGLSRPRQGEFLVFPHLGFGDFGVARLGTNLILIDSGSNLGGRGRIQFFQSDGSAMSVPLGDRLLDRASYLLAAGGGQQFRAGSVGKVAQIVFDPTNPAATEVVVNKGSVVHLNPILLDEEGNVVGNLTAGYSSLAPEIASVDDSGRIEGHREGFATLIVSAGGTIATATVTVPEVRSGAQVGFQIPGVAQDLAGRLYLANSTGHTILLAQDLQSQPEIYAGVSGTPGLKNEERLSSLFANPAFLAFDQAAGNLYVSDEANHVIRKVRPGSSGRVETLAGTGQPGNQDGPTSQATFDRPRGLAIDNAGHLWVADSGNHTIRRINLVSEEVDTIAGMAGSAGFADGNGLEARFDSPAGIALQRETLSQLLERELAGDPPPPVRLVVADSGNGALRRVSEKGQVETIAPLGPASARPEGLPSGSTSAFANPFGVAMDAFGHIYVSEPDSGQIKALLPTGEVVLAAQADTFLEPRGLAVTDSGRLVVTDGALSLQEITYGQPRITSLTPQRVNTRGGEILSINGSNFSPDSIVVVGGLLVTDQRILDTGSLIFIVPSLPSGRVTVSLQNRAGLAQTSLFVEAIPFSDLEPGEITTIAGGSSFAGDGGEARTAGLAFPTGLALDAEGNLLITDAAHSRIRRVDAGSGIIKTVVGDQSNFSGDGGPALAAGLRLPQRLALSPNGDLYIADTDNARIRKVDATTSKISTVAGNGEFGFSGDGIPALEASLNLVNDVAVDAQGNLYLADALNHRVRRVDRLGIITTIAGTGVDGFSGDGGPSTNARLNFPCALELDSADNLFIADSFNHRVRRVNLTSGVITTVAGSGEQDYSGDGGPATQAALSFPAGIAVDSLGNLFIADLDNQRVRKVDAVEKTIETVAGNGEAGFSGDGGPAFDASLDRPHDVLVDAAGNVLIADSANRRVRRIDARSGRIQSVVGASPPEVLGDQGRATSATLILQSGITIDAENHLIIADSLNGRVRTVDLQSEEITTLAGNGVLAFSEDDQPANLASLNFPAGVSSDDAGNIFIIDAWNHLVRKVDASSGIITTVAGGGEYGFLGDGGPATEAGLVFPEESEPAVGITLDEDGNLFFSETEMHRIRRVDGATGVIRTVAGNGEQGFSGDGGPAIAAKLDTPLGTALDGDGNLYFADYNNHRIRKIDLVTNIITTVAGNGVNGFGGEGVPATQASFSNPADVSFDPAGNLYIADTFNGSIHRVDTQTQIITTVAGNGDEIFGGDGGPAVDAGLSFPFGIAFDREGNLYISDTFNNRIRVVRAPIP